VNLQDEIPKTYDLVPATQYVLRLRDGHTQTLTAFSGDAVYEDAHRLLITRKNGGLQQGVFWAHVMAWERFDFIVKIEVKPQSVPAVFDGTDTTTSPAGVL